MNPKEGGRHRPKAKANKKRQQQSLNQLTTGNPKSKMEILMYVLSASAGIAGLLAAVVRSGGHRDAGIWLGCAAVCFAVTAGFSWYQNRVWIADAAKLKAEAEAEAEAEKLLATPKADEAAAGMARIEKRLDDIQSKMANVKKQSGPDFAKKYPMGYAIFSARWTEVIPFNDPSGTLKLDWKEARVSATNEKISLLLPRFEAAGNTWVGPTITIPNRAGQRFCIVHAKPVQLCLEVVAVENDMQILVLGLAPTD